MGDWVDAEPVRAYVRMLQQSMSDIEIERTAGLSRGYIHALLKGTAKSPPARRVRAERAAAILAVQSPPQPYLMVDRAKVWAIGLRRRVRALMRRGYNYEQIAQGARVGSSTLAGVASRYKLTVTEEVYRRVDKFYQSQMGKLGESRDVQLMAERRNYPPAEAWPGGSIDDPVAEPAWDLVPADFNTRFKVRWKPYRGYVEAGPVHDHVNALLDQNRSIASIALDANMNYERLYKIMYGGAARGRGVAQQVPAAEAAALLAVTSSPLPDGPKGLVDATGARRRIQALMFNDWTQAMIAAGTGLSERAINRISVGATRWTRREYHNAVERFFEEHWDDSGPAARRRSAQTRRQLGLIPALAWDDETIDDPTVEPSQPQSTDGVGAQRDENIRFLYQTGASLDEAAKRLGLKTSSLVIYAENLGLVFPGMSAWYAERSAKRRQKSQFD